MIEDLDLANPVIRNHYDNGSGKQYVRDERLFRTEPAHQQRTGLQASIKTSRTCLNRGQDGLRSPTIITMTNMTSWRPLSNAANYEDWPKPPALPKRRRIQTPQARSPWTAGGHACNGEVISRPILRTILNKWPSPSPAKRSRNLTGESIDFYDRIVALEETGGFPVHSAWQP